MQKIHYYIGFLIMLTMISLGAKAADIQINIDQNSTDLIYGVYSEVKIEASGVSGQINFKITDEMEPVGMQLSPVNNNTIVLHGVPEFLDRWCFLIEASRDDNIAIERVCLTADQNEKLEHPTFVTEKYLEKTIQGSQYNQEIIIKSNDNVTAEFLFGSLPEGVDISSSGNTLSLYGKAEDVGVYEFIVQAHVINNLSNEDQYVYKQFQLEVDKERTDYSCPRGYYYNQALGHCVPDNNVTCGTGTFYDPISNSCKSYRTPGHISCGPGYYYDHFLYRCQPVAYPRCPYNYEYDSYYRRCVRQPYSCSFGYRYSYPLQSCIYVGYKRCGINSYYSSYYGRCMPYYGYCQAGYSWHPVYKRCQIRVRYCGQNQYWDPYSRRCLRRYTRSCGAGYRRDSLGNCVRVRRAVQRCARGYHRGAGGRCTPNVRRPGDRGPIKRPDRRPPRRSPGTRPTPPRTRPTPPRKKPTPPRTRPTPPRKKPTPPRTRPTPPRKKPTPPRTRPTPPRKKPTPPRTRPTPPRKKPTPPRTRPTPPRKKPTPPRTRPTPPRKKPTPPRTRPTPPRKKPTPPRTRPTPPRKKPTPPRTRPRPTPPKRGGSKSGGKRGRG